MLSQSSAKHRIYSNKCRLLLTYIHRKMFCWCRWNRFYVQMRRFQLKPRLTGLGLGSNNKFCRLVALHYKKNQFKFYYLIIYFFCQKTVANYSLIFNQKVYYNYFIVYSVIWFDSLFCLKLLCIINYSNFKYYFLNTIGPSL